MSDQDKQIYYESEWIHELEQFHHWGLYWHQQKIIEDQVFGEPLKILEIGTGSGFTKRYLSSRGHAVTSIDIDPGKNPDVLADIREYELQEMYDLIVAYEVFEHFPFGDLPAVLKKLRAHCTGYMGMSVPEMWRLPPRKLLKFGVRLPFLKYRELCLQLPGRRKPQIERAHFWEVNLEPQYSISNLVALFSRCGFRFEEHIHHYQHHFFRFAVQ